MSEELTESTRQVLTTLVAQHGLGRVLEGLKDVCQANRQAVLRTQYDECDGPGRQDQVDKSHHWTRMGRALEELAGRVIHTETLHDLRQRTPT